MCILFPEHLQGFLGTKHFLVQNIESYAYMSGRLLNTRFPCDQIDPEQVGRLPCLFLSVQVEVILIALKCIVDWFTIDIDRFSVIAQYQRMLPSKGAD